MMQSPEDCASVINFVPFFGNEISSKKSEWDFGYLMQCTSILNHHSSNPDLPASRFHFWYVCFPARCMASTRAL